MTDAADFLALSELLTGETPLDQAAADVNRSRLAVHYPTALPRLLDAYRSVAGQGDPGAALFAAVTTDAELARIARETIAIWYTAQFAKPDNTQVGPDSPEHYRAGLVWRVIQAHPLSAPPVPGGYGSWSQHP